MSAHHPPATVRAIDESLGQYAVTAGRLEQHIWAVTGKYRITKYLASGSYGQVVRAQLTSDLSKTVVIKRTSDVFKFDPSFAKCALREIAIMRRLNHPNIVKIIDILEPEEGSPMSSDAPAPLEQSGAGLMFKNLYVVLEDGGVDLKKFFELQKEPLTIEQIRHISRQICAAMAYLHSCRVVHRDLKPANILIDADPSSPTYLHLRIADFGLSRAVELPPDCEVARPSAAAVAAVNPPSPRPRPIRKSQSEIRLLAAFDDAEFRTVAGEEGWHACLEMELQGLTLGEQFHTDALLTKGVGPIYAQMTAHVVTRPYRAPEAILCAGNYSQAIDVWSVGCILAELFELIREKAKRSMRPLFANTLPCAVREESQCTYAELLLKKIFALIGSPTPPEIRQLEALGPAPELLELLRKPELTGIPAKNFQMEFSDVPPAASALLREMLRFNAAPPAAAAPSPTISEQLPAGWQQMDDVVSGRACDINP